MTRKAPWDLCKSQEDPAAMADLSSTVFTIAEALRVSSILLQPVMPDRAADALDRLGVRAERRTLDFAIKGADAEYGVSFKDTEGRGAPGSLFPPLDTEEFRSEFAGQPLSEERMRIKTANRQKWAAEKAAAKALKEGKPVDDEKRKAMKARKKIRMAEKRADKALGELKGKFRS